MTMWRRSGLENQGDPKLFIGQGADQAQQPAHSNQTSQPPSRDAVRIRFPTREDIANICREASRKLIGDADNPSTYEPRDVAVSIGNALKALALQVRTSVSSALDKLTAFAKTQEDNGPKIESQFASQSEKAKAELVDAAKSGLEEVRATQEAKKVQVRELQAKMHSLPKTIADAHFACTGHPDVLVEEVDKKESERLLGWSIAITSLNSFLEMMLASGIFISILDDTTGYFTSLAFAMILGFLMHQRAVYGRLIDEYTKTVERYEQYKRTHPEEKREINPLAESIRRSYKTINWAIVLSGLVMGVLRMLAASRTGKLSGAIGGLAVTGLVTAIAIIGSEMLKRFASKYGEHHQTISSMKRRLAELPQEIDTLEATPIMMPLGLKQAAQTYTKNIDAARRAAESQVLQSEPLVANVGNILAGEDEYVKNVRATYLEACADTIEATTADNTANAGREVELEINRDELLQLLPPIKTDHPLATKYRQGEKILSTAPKLNLSAPTAEQVITELAQTMPAPSPAPTVAAKPAKKTVRVVLTGDKHEA